MKKTIGGDRLGAGKKMKVDLKSYNRSTHDLGYIWRSSMSAGTLVPFMTEVALPGDTFDIKLQNDAKTLPTVGPLFGSFKVQLDVFLCPIRLYQGQLRMNKLGVGNKMDQVKLPQITIETRTTNNGAEQINPSCIFSYLGIRGVGNGPVATTRTRTFNAVPYLAYWDIYKNYYANKQEEQGAVIHNPAEATIKTVTSLVGRVGPIGDMQTITWASPAANNYATYQYNNSLQSLTINYTGAVPQPEHILFRTLGGDYPVVNYFERITYETEKIQLEGWKGNTVPLLGWKYIQTIDLQSNKPEVQFFPLENIDKMGENILSGHSSTVPLNINKTSIAPYGYPLLFNNTENINTKMSSQEGLALKTYQSDLFNNWMSTEWIDGENGISAVTSIDTTEGSFSIDTLNLSKKVYEMLNRIAISGGSYDDWQDAVYDHSRSTQLSSPMYMGGLIKELVFEEVISNADSIDQPLGTLAGRGRLSGKNKGGNITIKVDEPSYIMGIVSLTPRVDYSQGNKWDVNLKTMNDFHKPALDEIGFQDLITDQMAYWDTETGTSGALTFKSAGKQPAWINYMTNVNQVRGNFALQDKEMFMTLNRRYEMKADGTGIKDLTTYIDPVKFNHIFAETSLDAQNFWVQIGVDITARRKMSAKIMPNL